MTEQNAQATFHDPALNQTMPAKNKQKKKASWLRTILWMISMVLLANAIMAILAYFLFFRNQ